MLPDPHFQGVRGLNYIEATTATNSQIDHSLCGTIHVVGTNPGFPHRGWYGRTVCQILTYIAGATLKRPLSGTTRTLR